MGILRAVDTLGKRVAHARVRKGWSQNRLDKEAKWSQGRTSRLERDERGPSAPTLAKVAELLGVRADWLLTGALPMEAEEPASSRSDPLPNRALAARLARDDGVYEPAIQSVVDEKPDERAAMRSVLWWADRMRLRQREMIDGARGVAANAQTPEDQSGGRCAEPPPKK